MSENFQFLKEGLIADLVGRLMSDYNFDMEKALDVVYSSDTLQKLSDSATGLSFLQDELRRGKL